MQAAIKGWLNKRLSLYTDAHLIYAIEHNVDLLAGMPETEKGFVRGMMKNQWAKDLVKKYDKLISADTVIAWWSKEHRPYGKTTGPDKAWADIILNWQGGIGRNWLEVQLTKFKQQLLELHGDLPT